MARAAARDPFMSSQTSFVLIVLCALVAFMLGAAIAVWSRRFVIRRLDGQCRALQAQLDNEARVRAAAVDAKLGIEQDLTQARAELQQAAHRIEQLRDLVKVHVARRREFDEWAGPIKASLGEAVGQALRTLKDQLARQESVLQRQERLVADTQDQYRAKRDEIERMRQELAIKNYHIAALNARFIRIEQRIGDLSSHLGGTPPAPQPQPPAGTGAVAAMTYADAVPQPTDRQLPVEMQERSAEEWTRLMDEWHKRLDRSFGEIAVLQAGLRSLQDDAGAPEQRLPDAPAGGESTTIQ